MSYKLPITKEKFLEAAVPKKKKKEENELVMKEVSGAESTVKKGGYGSLNEVVKTERDEKVQSSADKPKSPEEQKLDYYLNLINRYEGKTIGDIAKEKYESEYMSADTRTDEQLEEIANNYANAHKTEKKGALMQKAEEKINDLKKEQVEVNQNAEEAVKKAENEYNVKVKSGKANAIKNGIARSSIIANLIKSYDGEKAQKASDIRQKQMDDLTAANNQITVLEEGLKNALKALDMESAVMLNEELTRLKEERNKMNEKVASHNAKVDKKIQEYANELVKTADGKAIKELLENKGGEYMVKAKKALMEYVATLSKTEALAVLEREDINRLLGEDTVEMVKRYLKNTQ